MSPCVSSLGEAGPTTTKICLRVAGAVHRRQDGSLLNHNSIFVGEVTTSWVARAMKLSLLDSMDQRSLHVNFLFSTSPQPIQCPCLACATALECLAASSCRCTSSTTMVVVLFQKPFTREVLLFQDQGLLYLVERDPLCHDGEEQIWPIAQMWLRSTFSLLLGQERQLSLQGLWSHWGICPVSPWHIWTLQPG